MRLISIYKYVYSYVFRFQFEIKIPFVSCSLLSKKIEKYSQKSLATLRGVAGPHPFFGKNLSFLFNKKNPSASISFLSIQFSELFSAMLGHPEGRGRATPIFWQKLKFGIF